MADALPPEAAAPHHPASRRGIYLVRQQRCQASPAARLGPGVGQVALLLHIVNNTI